MAEPIKSSSYPFEWVRIAQCLHPVGPFKRSKLFELLKAGAIKSKKLPLGEVGKRKRPVTLVSVASLNEFLNGTGVTLERARRKGKSAKRAAVSTSFETKS
jgi:hypothetical protein